MRQSVFGNNPAMLIDSVLCCDINWGEMEAWDLVDHLQGQGQCVRMLDIFQA
jgi:hypothetical protein